MYAIQAGFVLHASFFQPLPSLSSQTSHINLFTVFTVKSQVMPNWLVVDDASLTIAYSSGWTMLFGSTRQWNGGVHSTSQAGASGTLLFTGVAVRAMVTIPAGNGSQVAQYSIDDGLPTSVTRTAASLDTYDVTLFLVDGLLEGRHKLVLLYPGGGGVPLQLDKFEYLPPDSDPSPSPIFPSNTLSSGPSSEYSPSPSSPIAPSLSGLNGSNEPSTKSDYTLSPGVIVGISIGSMFGLLALLLAAAFLIWRKRRGKWRRDPRDGDEGGGHTIAGAEVGSQRLRSVMPNPIPTTTVTPFIIPQPQNLITLPSTQSLAPITNATSITSTSVAESLDPSSTANRKAYIVNYPTKIDNSRSGAVSSPGRHNSEGSASSFRRFLGVGLAETGTGSGADEGSSLGACAHCHAPPPAYRPDS